MLLGNIHILRNQLRGEGGVSQMLMVDDRGEGGVGTKTTDYVNKGGVSEKFIYFPNKME